MEGGGAHPEPQRRQPCRPICGRGVLILGGGAPMQALTPRRWRPSLRHCDGCITRVVRPLLKCMNKRQQQVFYTVRKWCLDKVNG